MDFEKDITINKYELDIEWEKQPALFHYYSKKNVEATTERDRTKQKKDVVIAELRTTILNDCLDQNQKKPTENAIDAEVAMNILHKEVTEELINANENVALTDAAKWAIQQKKDALENMVKLFLAGYWSDPKIPKEAKKQANEKVTRQLKRSLRK